MTRSKDGFWKDIPCLDFTKVKQPRPLIENFVMKGTTQICYGKFGTRKTTLHLLAGWCVAQGIPFLGMKTERHAVLYLDYENPASVLKAYCGDLQIDCSGPMFRIWDRSAGGPPPKPGDKRLGEFIHDCRKATGHHPWIIFDSWTSLLRVGASGNDIADVTEIFRAIRAYCDRGTTVTIIDHTGKKGKGPIGSSAKMSQLDTASLITIHTNKDITGKASVATVRVETFLKRFAPEGVGTFSMEIRAAKNKTGEWHTLSVEPTKDRSVRRTEKRISAMQHLISKNRTAGKEGLAALAVEGGLESRDDARELLEQGAGTFWKAVKIGKNKIVFRVIRG